MKKLLLIDGSNLIFRSYFATAAMGNLMMNSTGLYTNAIYGLASSMQSILKMEYSHIVVALDPKGKTHRHELFEEYKGTRKETPSELVVQFPFVQEYFDASGIYALAIDTYEADDIIGYCATHYKDEFDEVMIISNDHDLMQLIDDKVSQMVSKKGFSEVDIYTPAAMMDKLGIRPDQMIDYKALVGDTSDNIPGIRGIGDKTAQKLLSDYQTLDNLYAHVDEISGKLREKLIEGKEVAYFSQKLATVLTDFDNQIDISKAQYLGPNWDKLVDFYKKMEFHSLLRRLSIPKKEAPVDTPKSEEFSYRVLNEETQIQKALESEMALLLETYGSNYHSSERLCFALAGKKGISVIPYDIAKRSPAFVSWLIDPKQHKHTFDLKAMCVSLMWDDLPVDGIEFDLLLAAYLINPLLTKEDFKVIVSSFDYQDVSYDEEIYQKGAKYAIPDKIDIVYEHAAKKAKAIFVLKDSILSKNKEYDQLHLLNEIEIPLAKTLSSMEYFGIRVDEIKLEEIGQDLLRRSKDHEQLIYDLAMEEFNINSPKQLGVILFEKLNLPYSKKTKTGYSTDASVLQQLIAFHPIASAILDYRQLTKLYSTYYEGLKQSLCLKNDGRIHTIYKQALTQTGRLSSIEPNLQNIPIKTDEGKNLRKVFVKDEGTLLYSCDYSQIELRVLAHMANVKELKASFSQNEDVHTSTAKKIFHKQEITSSERRMAKAINFGIIYGKTPWGLSEDLGISPKQAERFIAEYFELYPEIKTFMDQSIQDAVEKGYVSTMFHRRRYIPEATASNYQTREFGKRMAMNAPIQGSAADILKIAMVKIQNELQNRHLRSKMVLQIHDELVFVVDVQEKDEVESLVNDLMQHAVEVDVPLLIEASFGDNLFEVK